MSKKIWFNISTLYHINVYGGNSRACARYHIVNSDFKSKRVIYLRITCSFGYRPTTPQAVHRLVCYRTNDIQILTFKAYIYLYDYLY